MLQHKINTNKNSAVAEMGDRARAKWAEKWGRCCASFRNWRELGFHLTQCRLGRGLLPPYQVVSWCIQSFDHNKQWPKSGGCFQVLCPWGRTGSPSNTISPRPMPTSVRSGVVIHPAVWPHCTPTSQTGQTGQDRQLSDSIERTVLQTVGSPYAMRPLSVLSVSL